MEEAPQKEIVVKEKVDPSKEENNNIILLYFVLDVV